MYLHDLTTLRDILEEIKPKPLFNDDEKLELIESTICYMDDFINDNALLYSNPQFHDILNEYLFKSIIIQVENISDYDIEEDVNMIIDESNKIYFQHSWPKRSFCNTFINKKINKKFINNISKKLTYIKEKPQPEQRTDEWHEYRHTLITASAAWKALNSEAKKNEIIYEKCAPLEFKSYGVNTPLHWGQKYEPVSVMIYEDKYKTKVDDFGCIKHDKFNFLGASPDGINTNTRSQLFGRMLEIKNVVSRIINGIPKEDYWIQMQLQMETCDLDECDFLETGFIEYPSEEEFLNDGSFTTTKNNKMKGIIINFQQDGKPLYEYMPLHLSKDEYDVWCNEMMETHADLTWVKNIYWYLDQYSCILVLRNKLWFKYAIKEIENVWNIILKERKSGYKHRAPKKKSKKSTTIEIKQSDGCLISIADLSNNLNIDLDVLNQDEDEDEISIESEKPLVDNSDNNDSVETIIHIETKTVEESQQV